MKNKPAKKKKGKKSANPDDPEGKSKKKKKGKKKKVDKELNDSVVSVKSFKEESLSDILSKMDSEEEAII